MAKWLVLLLLPLVSSHEQESKNKGRILIPGDAFGNHVDGMDAKFRDAALCPEGEQVIGFRLQHYENDEKDFKLGITGVELKCQGGSILGPEEVNNLDLSDCDWGEWLECENGSVVTGINVRHDPRDRRDHKNKHLFGISEIKMECSNGKVLGPEGIPVGNWARPVMTGCKATSKLCGFAAEIEKYAAGKESVAVNRVKFICCRQSTEFPPSHPKWTLLGQDVCIGSRNERYGLVKMPVTGLLGTIAFMYLHGELRCLDDAKYGTNFGCDLGYDLRDKFSIFVTKNDDKVIFPDDTNQKTPDIWFYEVVGMSSRDAKQFALQIKAPVMLEEGEELRVWYGEDLGNRGEGDNGDAEVCVHVYGKIIN